MRRKLVWARFFTTGTSVLTDTHDLLQDWRADMGIDANLPGTTIMRIRSTLVVEIDAVTDVVPADGVLAGAIVHTRLAGAGAPTPGGDPSSDWMYWEKLHPNLEGRALATHGVPFAFRLDIRAKRRMEEINESLTFVVSSSQAPVTIDVQHEGSVLLALP